MTVFVDPFVLLTHPLAFGEAPFVVIIMIAFAVIVIGGIIYGYHAEKKRRQLLHAYAGQLGFRFSEDKDHGFDDRYEGFSCLDQGHSRYGYNIGEGEINGRGCMFFDYHYATTSTDSKGRTRTTHHYFSGVVVDSGLAMKPLFIRQEHFGDKIFEFFGKDDIDFESLEFSRKFHVKSPDRRFAYDVIPQKTIELLLDSPRFSMQVDGPLVMAWRSKRFDPTTFRQAFDLVGGFLDRIPADIQKELRLGL